MYIIAEKVNVITTSIKEAMIAREKGPIQAMVTKQLEGKPDCIDINLGPATKNGPEIMQWMVETIEEVTDLPLSLDTMNMDAMEAGLKVGKNPKIVNSVSSVQERMDRLIPLVIEYKAKAVGLCTSEAGVPRDAEERVTNGYNLMMAFEAAGLGHDDYWIDPIVLPIGVAQDQVHALLDATQMFSELPEKPHLVCGLSNVSNKCGLTAENAEFVNRIFLAALMGHGMDGAIVDPNDEKLMAVARMESPEYDLTQIAEGLKEGELDMNNPLHVAIKKTVKLFHEETLFAASYLEL
jgi:5-methyltetrahydrofolate corrinoid/iron sulfur protein methyltransferase